MLRILLSIPILAELSLPSKLSASELLTYICEEFNLENFRNNLILALNETYVEVESEEPVFLQENDEVAVIPPISGG